MYSNSEENEPVPFFSVIVPMYNKGPHIKRCVESALRQKNVQFELIVVNDASTDDSLDHLMQIIENCKNVKVLTRSVPGPGGYAARNLAAANARGTWLAFLDADDEWKDSHLDNLYQHISRKPESTFLSTNCFENYGNGKIYPANRVETTSEASIDLPTYLQLTINSKNPVFTSACAMRKDFFFDIGQFPEHKGFSRGGDRETWLRAVSRNTLEWLPEPTAIYHRDSVNMVTKKVAPKIETCSDDTIKDLLRSDDIYKRFPGVRTLLKKYSNYIRRSILKKKIRSGNITFMDLSFVYFRVDPLWYIFIAFSILLAPCIKCMNTITRKSKKT